MVRDDHEVAYVYADGYSGAAGDGGTDWSEVRPMANKIMYIAANILMVVEAVALVYLIKEWRKAKKEERKREQSLLE